MGLRTSGHDRYSGRVFRNLNVIDEANRGALGIDVAVSIPATRVTIFLAQMIDLHGRPAAIRCDNGPELTSQTFTDWCKEQEIEIRFIQPGKPDQNAYIERFNQTYRGEVLSAYLFDSLDEVRDITANWLDRYNEIRPHDALGSLPPALYRERLLAVETPVRNCLLDGGAYDYQNPDVRRNRAGST
jgi:putative transposase